MQQNLQNPNDKELDTYKPENKGPEKRSPLERVPPYILIGAALIIILIIRALTLVNESDRKMYYFIIGVILLILILLGKQNRPDNSIVTPEEAENLVEHFLMRKKKKEQWLSGMQYKVTPVNNICHTDACGNHYEIGVEVSIPNEPKPQNWLAKVQMKGEERGFVSLVESVTHVTGRETQQMKIIKPPYLKHLKDDPTLERIWLRGGGRGM